MSDTQQSPEVSPEARLANFLDPQPEAAPEQEEQVEEAVYEAEAEEEEESSEAELEEFELDEGNTVKVPKELKPYLERRADYSKKTAEVAVLREQAQDRMQFAEAREHLMGAVFQEVGQLQGLQSTLTRLQNIDTSQLTLEQKWDWQQQTNQLERQIAQVSNAIRAKAQDFESKQALHAQSQWEMAERGFLERNGKVPAEVNVAMQKAVTDLGFTDRELKMRFADPRFLALVHKAARWDLLQQGKPAAVATASKAPPVVKVGAVTNTQTVSKDKALRQRLKQSGDLKDAAALFARIMR